MRIKIPSVFIFLFFSCLLVAQDKQPAYWKDIQAFKKQDSINFPPPGQILFTGSSTFRLWKDVQADFPAYPIINRGFGGSTLPDVIRYVNDIILPYHAKQIVIYCGENDFAESDTVSVATVVNRFLDLFNRIRMHDNHVHITYVSMKPSQSRQKLLPKYREANRRIKKFLQKTKRTSFINVYDRMLKPDGTPMDDIFLADHLHMNAKGYAIWQKAIRPYLLK